MSQKCQHQKSHPFCGPKICWVCPHPNYQKNWLASDKAKGVDQVRKNIYFGGVICDFKPRSDINDRFCDRNFISSNNLLPPPYEYANKTETEFYLKAGESSGCSSFWKYRYHKLPQTLGGSGSYQRTGPALFESR